MRLSNRFYFVAFTLIIVTLLGLGYYIARNWNPTRPLIGEPSAKHFDNFATNYHNLCLDKGHGFVSSKAELLRTNSLTHPLVGKFTGIDHDGAVIVVMFAWQNRHWVDMSGRPNAIADEAQR